MNATDGSEPDGDELKALADVFHQGAAEASRALETWLNTPSLISIDAVEQVPLHAAMEALGDEEAVLCFCTAEFLGPLTGELTLAFDDASGLKLADLLLRRPPKTTVEWGELEVSAALETTNIVGSAYLNALARLLPSDDSAGLLPSPPRFHRDFAAALLQSALMNQAAAGEQVLLARSLFELDGEPVRWTLLLIPDAASVGRLGRLLRTTAPDKPPGQPGGAPSRSPPAP